METENTLEQIMNAILANKIGVLKWDALKELISDKLDEARQSGIDDEADKSNNGF